MDPSAGTAQCFAFELRTLREQAGAPTYRAMARIAGYSVTALSQAAAGEKLPTRAVALAYVKACGGDTVQWEQRWQDAARQDADRRAEADPEAELGTAPYRGLARYEPDDAERFFGRTQPTDDLVRLACAHRFVVVFGPSGSGKSSLLRAGLIPRLRAAQDLPVHPAALRILTPGPHPQQHEKLLVPDAASGDTWLVVDQFEELFTLCPDPDIRTAFIDRLLTAQTPENRLRVVLGVRADFYGRCLEHPGLAAAIQQASLPVGPMGQDGLREVIVKSAVAQGLTVERTLTARLLDEVAGEPGGLPLLSHTLLETWRRRHRNTLTLAAYEAAGGLHGAIAQTAEAAYARLTPDQTVLARRFLLRLITPGDGTPDTRRPVDRTELDFDRPQDTTVVLERLARARLVILDDDRVDLAHEALVTAWPRLQEWIDEDRDRLRLHRQLTDAAQAWREGDRDRGVLLRGSRLEAAWEAFGTGDGAAELTLPEREFLTASRTAAARERSLRQAAVAVLAVLMVLAVVAAGLAWGQRKDALAAQRQAQSRQLAAQSQTLLAADPDLASLLAVAAYRTSPTTEASASLYAAAALPLQRRLAFSTTEGKATVTAFAPDGRTLAAGSANGAVRLWDTATGRSRTLAKAVDDAKAHKTPGRATHRITALSFSPDGRSLAVGSDGGTIRVWDTVLGRTRAQVTFKDLPDAPETLAFDHDSRTLTITLGHGTIRQWEPSTGTARTLMVGADDLGAVSGYQHTTIPDDYDATVRLKDPADGQVRTVAVATHIVFQPAVSPDGRTIALGQLDGTVRLRDTATGRTKAALKGSSDANGVLRFSPDGRTVAAGYGTVRLWDTASGSVRTLTDSRGTYDLVFSADGSTLAAAAASGGEGRGAAFVWDVATGRSVATLTGYTDHPGALAAARDGHAIATVSGDGTVRLNDLTHNRRTRTLYTSDRGRINAAAVSPDGRTVATGDTTATLWDTADGHLRATLPGPTHMEEVQDLAFTPDSGAVAATGGLSVSLWDPASGRVRNGRTDDHTGVIGTVLSPDGRTRATRSARNSTVSLWDIATGQRRATLPSSKDRNVAMTFSPDSHTIAMASSTALRLWDSTTGQLRTTATSDPRQAHTSPSPKDKSADLSCSAVREIVFSPDGRTLATRDSQRVTIWDVVTGRAQTAVTGPCDDGGPRTFPIGHMAFSPDGRTLAAADGRQVQLWDAATGRARAVLTGHADTVQDLAFSPDGRTLATAGSDRTIHLWDVARHHTYTTLTGHISAVTKVLYNPDGRSLYTIGDDNTLRQWDVAATDPAAAIRKICTAVSRDLTRPEQSTYLPGQHSGSVCHTPD